MPRPRPTSNGMMVAPVQYVESNRDNRRSSRNPLFEPGEPYARYKDILDGLPVVAFFARPDGSMAYFSHAWRELTGIDPQQIVGGDYLSVVRPDQRARVATAWDAARAAESTYRDEMLMRFGDGSYRWILSVANPMRDAHGEIVGWFGNVIDIDLQKRVEDELRAQVDFSDRLIESSDDCIKILSRDGRIVWISDQGQKLLRIDDVTAMVGVSWLDFWQGRALEAARAAVASAQRGEAGRFTGEYVTDEGTRAFDVVVTPIPDRNGLPERLLVVSRDVSATRRASAARDRLITVIEKSNDFIAIADLDGRAEYINDAGRAMLEIGSLDLAIAAAPLDFFRVEDREFVQTVIVPTISQQGRWIGDFQFRNFRTNDAVPVAYTSFQLVDHAGTVTGTATLASDRRPRLKVDAGMRLLSRTGAAIDSLDYMRTLQNVTQAFVADFATFCVVDTAIDGVWQRTVADRGTEKAELLASLPRPNRFHSIADALERGISRLTIVDDAWLASIDSTRALVLREVGISSFITVPVVTVDGTIVGALTCARDRNHPSGDFDERDLPFAEEAARRAASAVVNTRLYERERRIAIQLQAASLPARLPSVPHFRISAEYRPGSDEATIGGDWYDAFDLADGRVALSVGDVLGHGLHAAITMTKLRQAMQAAAMVVPDPNVMLRVADRTLRLVDPDAYATAVAALYDHTAQTLTFASAGHPGLMVRTPDGCVREHTSPGTLLGLHEDAACGSTVVAMPPGTIIVFFTDGLIEATRDIAEGLRRLREAMARDEIVYAAQPAKAIVDFVLDGGAADDDVAVLVAHVG